MKKDNLLKFELSLLEKKLIKAVWIHENKIYILCIPKHIRILTKNFAKKWHIAHENVRVGTIEDLVREIIHHNTWVIISVRDGKIIYDPLRLLHSLKINVQKGLMVGTKEGILRKFMLIKDSIKKIEGLKTQVFDNIYISVIEAAQTALVMKCHIALIPRMIPKKLKKYLSKDLEKRDIINASEIIYTYKMHEHKKINLPSGRRLDELSKKAELFREAVKKLK